MLKTILLILAVSADSFAAAAAIGSAGIKLPVRSGAVISVTGTAALAASVILADMAGGLIPKGICRVISSALLILLGLANLLHGRLRKLSESRNKEPSVFFDGRKADMDNSKSISCKEGFLLSAALSADSFVTGISAGLGEINLPFLILMSLVIGYISVAAGVFIGRRLIYTGNVDLQWLGGVILIIVALMPYF